SRLKDKNDHDAKSMGAKVVAGWAEGRAGRAVAIARGDLARAAASVPEVARDATLGGKVFAAFERAPRPVLFHLEATEVHAGDRVVLRDVRLDIGREDRVRVTGENGAGKTTLLSALLAANRREDRVVYLPQELSPADRPRLAVGAFHSRHLGEAFHRRAHVSHRGHAPEGSAVPAIRVTSSPGTR
ncbi:MAG: ATP-binding cassette domain-containing protein, partial [Actinomycetales bacterium]